MLMDEEHLMSRHSSYHNEESAHIPVLAVNGTQITDHYHFGDSPTTARRPPPRFDSITPTPRQPESDTDGDDEGEDGSGSLEENTGSITSVD